MVQQNNDIYCSFHQFVKLRKNNQNVLDASLWIRYETHWYSLSKFNARLLIFLKFNDNFWLVNVLTPYNL